MPSEKQIEAARELVRRSLVFANWAAGEGIAPIEGSIKEPADFLMDFSDATDVDDWDGLAEQVLSILTIAEQAEPAPAARSGAVKVKPLEWKDERNCECSAETVIGTYEVGFDDGWWAQLEGGVKWDWNPPYDPRSYEGPSAAKAAAQADYERRILAALEPAEPATDAEPVAWADVLGFEALYEVSTTGDVRSKKTGRVLSKNLAGAGYVKAELWKDNKRHQTYVHRLVAQAFVDGDGSEINHKNGIKTDNRASNLEWSNRSRNTLHAYYELGHIIQPITATHSESGEVRKYRSIEDAVRDGFKSAHIYRALKNPRRKVLGFHFTKDETRPPESRLREALEEIADLKTVRDRPDDYNRGFADGRWQAVKIARAALAQGAEDERT